jgi:hypothetical protein
VAFDHVAIEVPDLDGFIDSMTSSGLMRLLRRGTRTGSGQRLAMLVDEQGQKVELIEGAGVRFLHLAFQVADVAAAHAALVDAGAAPVRAPQRIEAAGALSSMVQAVGGVEVQLVRYDDDSPDRTGPVPVPAPAPAGPAIAGG